MKCPKCGNTYYVKFGRTRRGNQRFRCKTCGSSFCLEEYPNNINLSANKRNKLIASHILDRKNISLTDIEKNLKTGYSKQTLLYLRHKILIELIKEMNRIILDGTIQIDEIYFPINYKGNHKSFKMPRAAHKRSNEIHSRGISREQFCVITALDDKGRSIAIPLCAGRPSQTKVYDAFKNNIKEGSVLISDSTTCYNKIVKQLKLTQKQIPHNKHKTKDGFHIQNLNNYHSRLRSFMSNLYGVSTKFLPEYVAWFAFYDRDDLTDKEKTKILQRIMTVVDLKSVRKIQQTDRIPKQTKSRKRRSK